MIRRPVTTLMAATVLVLPGLASVEAAQVAVPALALPASACFTSTDNGDPVMTGFTVSPQVVDSRDGAKTVTFTVTGRDTGGPGPASGLREATVYLGLGDGNYNISVTLRPTSSDTLSGALVVLPQFRTADRTVEGVDVGDWSGNGKHYDHAALAELGFPNTLSTVTHFDTTRPQLTSLKLSTTSVDTRRHARRITVTARVTDDSAGVAEVLVGFKDL